MDISPTHFNYYLSKQPIKGIYLVVKVGGIDVTADYEINKPSANPNSLPVCATKKYSCILRVFIYYKSSRVLEVTISFLSRCVRESNLVIQKKKNILR